MDEIEHRRADEIGRIPVEHLAHHGVGIEEDPDRRDRDDRITQTIECWHARIEPCVPRRLDGAHDALFASHVGYLGRESEFDEHRRSTRVEARVADTSDQQG